MSKPILCVDFDGVLHSYDSGWQGAGIVPDPPVPGAIEFLELAVRHFDVQIYSSRSSQPGGINAMRAWLDEHVTAFVDCKVGGSPIAHERRNRLLEAISFPKDKPSAFLTIDDRAICFDGKWENIHPRTLLRFKPWNKAKDATRPDTWRQRLVRMVQRIKAVIATT